MGVTILSCILIITGSVGISFDIAGKMEKRKIWYENMIEFLRLLLINIRYGNLEIEECLIKMKLSSKNFFNSLVYEILKTFEEEEGDSFSNVWEKAVNNFEIQSKEYGCKKTDMDMLFDLGNKLGENFQQKQVEQLQGILECTIDKKNSISENLEKRQKAVRFLGISTGIFIILLLI